MAAEDTLMVKTTDGCASSGGHRVVEVLEVDGGGVRHEWAATIARQSA